MDSQSDFDTRLIQWRQSYQEHLRLLAYFHRWREGYEQQQALWESHRGPFHTLRKDVARLREETLQNQEPLP